MKNFKRRSQGFNQWMEKIKSTHLAEVRHNPKRNFNILERMYEKDQYN